MLQLIRRINPEKKCLSFKVRVIRLWKSSGYSDPIVPFSLEMVLMDEEGGKIQASVRKTMINKILQKVKEGNVYKMTYFGVIPNGGNYRATAHEFRLVFLTRTTVIPCECEMIPRYGLNLVSCQEVSQSEGELNYLVDVIGLLTAISTEREYVKDGRLIKMVVMELSDDKGKIQCALFSEYAKLLADFLAISATDLPVIVVQFAKVKMFRGKIVMQNAFNVTRIFFDPDIAEAIKFREGLILHGIDISRPLGRIGERPGPKSFEEDFLNSFEKKTLSWLLKTDEDGMFVVYGKITNLVEGEQWYYPACSCHKALAIKAGLFYCDKCEKYVVNMTPRYRIKAEVSDEVESAVFTLFDADTQALLNKSCVDVFNSVKDPSSGVYPSVINTLVGREMLFRVEKKIDSKYQFDESFRVWKVCVECSIINAFRSEESLTAALSVEVDANLKSQTPLDTPLETPSQISIDGSVTETQICATVSLGVDDNDTIITQTRSQKRKIGTSTTSVATMEKNLKLKEVKIEKNK